MHLALSAKGAKIGIDKTANPVVDWIKNPKMKKIKSITIANGILCMLPKEWDKPFKIVSAIFPSSYVILIPPAKPIIKDILAKSPTPLVKFCIASSSPRLDINIKMIPNTKKTAVISPKLQSNKQTPTIITIKSQRKANKANFWIKVNSSFSLFFFFSSFKLVSSSICVSPSSSFSP